MIVLWRISTVCNLACGFCAYDRRLRLVRQESDPAEVERFAALLGAYGRAHGEDMLISWLGGEPLLWPGVLALSQRLRESHGLRISVTTNGSTLHRPGVVEAMAAAFDEVTLSIDDVGEAHERLRGWPGGWRRLEQGIARLVAQRGAAGGTPKLRVNTVLMHDTLERFPALCDRLADWGVDEITFNQLGGRDRPQYHAGHALRAADVAWLRTRLPPLAARMAGRGVRLCAHDAYLDRFEASATGRAIAVADCAPRRPTIFIDEHGRIAPCSFTIDHSPMSTRDIRTAHDVTALRARLAVRQSAAVCADCPSTQVFAKFGT
ncbi:radical SAM protein [Dyella marensis]|uniref:radical SAM protein n=1 Tax=Dyella marensis TaxID=500610 RepID=UPI0031E0A2C8